MEGSADGFLKRVRVVRTEAAAKEEQACLEAEEQERKEIELAVPAPPYMSPEDARLLVNALETHVLEFAKENHRLSEGYVPIGSRTLDTEYATTFPSNTMLATSPWWNEVCAWAMRIAPTQARFRPRYVQLVRECFERVRDAWNAAHPHLPARFGAVYGMLLISLHIFDTPKSK